MIYIALACLFLLAVVAAIVSSARVKNTALTLAIGVGLAHVFQFLFATATAILITHPIVPAKDLALWQLFIANALVVSATIALLRRGTTGQAN